jgi:SOS-response transcriptional repressor LexA
VLYAIAVLLAEHHYSPSFRDICTMLDLASTNALPAHLEWLESNGYIDRMPKASRTLQLTKKGWGEVVGEPLAESLMDLRKTVTGALRERCTR